MVPAARLRDSFKISLGSTYACGDKRAGEEWLEPARPFPPPCWVTCSWKNVHVLGPVQCLCRLSIHGDLVSHSPPPNPSNFKFKLCVLYVSPDGKISLYPGSRAAEGQG